MQSKLLRTDHILGNSKVIIGDLLRDLVLETLGKVYIKSGRNFKLLNDVSLAISNLDENNLNVVLVQSSDNLYQGIIDGTYKDGQLVFEKDRKILYIVIDNKLVPIVNAEEIDKQLGYVAKAGDTMYGLLKMETTKPPFILKSTRLVENLNANYLYGYKYSDFAIKHNNETISGNWYYSGDNESVGKWIFRNTVSMFSDLITSASIGTPYFSSGYAGSGWRLDGTTNTLTIDNLVVRKVMRVFELIVNQIKATNGSLWVSNSAEIQNVFNVNIISSVLNITLDSIKPNNYYIFEEANASSNYEIKEIDGKRLSSNISKGETTKYIEYKYMYFIEDISEIDSIETLLNVEAVKLLNKIQVYEVFSTTEGNILDKESSMCVYIEDANEVVDVLLYYKYFGCTEGHNNYTVIKFDLDSKALFEVGDIVRCLKFTTYGDIKHYDALIINRLSSNVYLMLLALSVFDLYSELQYDENGDLISQKTEINKTLYQKGGYYTDKVEENQNLLGKPASKDGLVHIGSIQNELRQNAIYLTSTDDLGPFMDIISGVNRPDYSVLYKYPVWIKYKLYFVSNTYIPESTYLGIFKIDENTNYILEENYTGEDGQLLYGYLKPNSKCLAERYKNSNNQYVLKYDFTKNTKCRLGNLDGIYNYKLGNKLPYGFGLYADNAFLTGEFYLNNGKSVASFADDILLLSGKIEEIDPESIINEVENAFSATDEDGNPSGFAGLFTFDYGEEGGKGLAILGDTINFYNPDSEGNYNWESPTALIRNGILNADLIDVKELEFDKLVGVSNYNPEVLESLLFLWKENGEVFLEGEIIGTDSPIPAVIEEPTNGNYIKNLTLYLLSFCVKTENGDIYKVLHNGDLSDDWSSSKLEANSVIVDIPHIWYTDTNIPWNNVRLINTPISFELSVEPVYTAQDKEYNVISINKNSLGETILYYPDGSVLNAKIVSQSSDKSSVIGCVEYWFQQGSITPELLLEGGDSYVVNNYIDGGDPNSENYINGLIKRINYFNFVDKFGISWRTVLTGADSIDEWINLITTLGNYANLGDVFNYFNDLHEEASSGNGLYGSSYSTQISNILATFGRNPSVNSTVGQGTGSGIITWEDSTTTNPVGMWFTYKLGLSDTINTYIEETNSSNNTSAKKDSLLSYKIDEGLHILNYSYTNDNTGRFDIEYFNYSESIVERIRFTINNGLYNGVILAPTN